jgi:hypothetical protein
MNRFELDNKLQELGIKRVTYSLFGEYLHPSTGSFRTADALILDKISDVWTVFYINERGAKRDVSYNDVHGNEIKKEFFGTEEEACEYLYGYYEWYVSRNPVK